MKIEEFGVERWMDLYETQCTYNLAETCVESISLADLFRLTNSHDAFGDLLSTKLTYGAIRGSERLRASIAKLYERQRASNVLIAHGAIGANSLVYSTLVEAGDHVIAVLPTYQQHQSIPKSLGAHVDLLPLREQNFFLPDLQELRSLLSPKTKLLALNNPNNPTGALMNEKFLKEIIALVEPFGTYILCDEVYRGLDNAGSGFSASIADLYPKGISTGSMSKVYSLAGLRLGWIVSEQADFLDAVMVHRDYNTISVGVLDDYFSCLALEAADKILERSQTIARGNRKILSEWVKLEPSVSWIPPQSGTTALLKYAFDLPSWDFCVRLLEKTGVMLCPGSVLNTEGYVRIGYANNPAVLDKGLALFSEFLKDMRKENG